MHYFTTLLCALMILPASQADEMSVEAREVFERAYAELRVGNNYEAELLYAQAVELAPDAHDVWMEYTVVLRKIQRFQSAARAAWRTLELGEPSSAEWTNLGNVFLSAHEWEAAEMAFEKAEPLFSDKRASLQNFLNLGYQQWAAGDFKGAEVQFKAAMRKDRASGMAVADLACVYASQGKTDRALREFDKAIKLCEKQADESGLSYARGQKASLTQNGSIDFPSGLSASYQTLPAVLLMQPAPGTAQQLPIADTVRKHFALPDFGVLSIDVGEAWREVLNVEPGLMVIEFTARDGSDFSIQISPIALEQQPGAAIELAKDFATGVEKSIWEEAVPETFETHEIESETVWGSVALLTDKSLVGTQPVAWEFLHGAAGAFAVGELVCTYTALFTERNDETLSHHFNVMKSMSFERP